MFQVKHVPKCFIGSGPERSAPYKIELLGFMSLYCTQRSLVESNLYVYSQDEGKPRQGEMPISLPSNTSISVATGILLVLSHLTHCVEGRQVADDWLSPLPFLRACLHIEVTLVSLKSV